MTGKKRELLILKHVSEGETYKMLFFFLLGTLAIGRGVVFISLDPNAVAETEYYTAIDKAFPIEYWGTLLVVFAAIQMLFSFSKRFMGVVILIISNFILGITFALLSGAAVDNTVTFWTGYVNLILATVYITTAVLGAYWQWTRTMKKGM